MCSSDLFLGLIIVENFPNMGKEIVNQVQEAQRVPYRINPRRNTPTHILIKLLKIKYKEKILKAARKKQISDMEYRIMEITAKEQNKEKRMKRNEDSLRFLWDNTKCTNI